MSKRDRLIIRLPPADEPSGRPRIYTILRAYKASRGSRCGRFRHDPVHQIRRRIFKCRLPRDILAQVHGQGGLAVGPQQLAGAGLDHANLHAPPAPPRVRGCICGDAVQPFLEGRLAPIPLVFDLQGQKQGLAENDLTTALYPNLDNNGLLATPKGIVITGRAMWSSFWFIPRADLEKAIADGEKSNVSRTTANAGK